MSADLPEAHADPRAMARCLASYISSPDEIFRRVKAEFGTSPCHATIQEMRDLHLKPPQPVDPWKPHDGYYPADAAASLAKTNARFLTALQDERSRSAQRALNSTYLTQKPLVNKRWDSTIEKARAA